MEVTPEYYLRTVKNQILIMFGYEKEKIKLLEKRQVLVEKKNNYTRLFFSTLYISEDKKHSCYKEQKCFLYLTFIL